MSTPDPKPVPVHPAKQIVRVHVALAVSLAVLGSVALPFAGALLASVLYAFAAFFVYSAITTSIRMPAVQLINLAVQQLTRGDVAGASAHLAQIGARARRDSNIARAILLVDALSALHENRLAEAEVAATAAVELGTSLLLRSIELQQRTVARATRALVRAARGDVAGAKEDADVAEQSEHASPEVLARTRLVRAVLMTRLVYHEEALRTYLVENAQLVLEHGMPRERMLFRALRRMSRSPSRSVYREPGRAGDDRAPSKTATWIAAIAPEAAIHVAGSESA